MYSENDFSLQVISHGKVNRAHTTFPTGVNIFRNLVIGMN